MRARKAPNGRADDRLIEFRKSMLRIRRRGPEPKWASSSARACHRTYYVSRENPFVCMQRRSAPRVSHMGRT